MRKPLLRAGCILLVAGVLSSCSLLPAASPLPEQKTQEQPLYNADVLNDGKLRQLYLSDSSTVLCGSTVLYEGRTTDSISLVEDLLTGEVNYYMVAWSDNTTPNGRLAALYDKNGNVVLNIDRDYYAETVGNLLVLSNESDILYNNKSADPYTCRVFDLSTGEELPKPENAVNCIVSGDILVFRCYERPAELSDGEDDDDFYYHYSTVLCDKAGNTLKTFEHTQAISKLRTLSPEWVELWSYSNNAADDSLGSSFLYNTLTGETLTHFGQAFGNGIISRTTEEGRTQLVDIASTEQPEVLCEFDSNISYYAPGVAILSAKNHDDYRYEFHDLTTGEVKPVYNTDTSDNTLAFYTTDGTLRVYNLTTGALLTDLTVEPVENMSSVSVSAQGEDYVALRFNQNGSFDYPLVQEYNAEGLVCQMDATTLDDKYDSIETLLFANGQPYFQASRQSVNGILLYDVLDAHGNVILSNLHTCYSYYTSSLNALPEGVFVAQKGFYYGWMDLSGQWVYCQSIFSAATDEDDINYYY